MSRLPVWLQYVIGICVVVLGLTLSVVIAQCFLSSPKKLIQSAEDSGAVKPAAKPPSQSAAKEVSPAQPSPKQELANTTSTTATSTEPVKGTAAKEPPTVEVRAEKAANLLPPTADNGIRLVEGGSGPFSVAQARLAEVRESKLSPGISKPAGAGMKFFSVVLLFTEVPVSGKIATDHIFLAGSSGKQYGPPHIYGVGFETPGIFEMELRSGNKINIYFPVEENEEMTKTAVVYR
ncbi:MAG: hypothetical protein NTY01_00310 [Verrucomicrobia bacterium]|nr:hypothetical protein [Verrucomicrobiota bacterium]